MNKQEFLALLTGEGPAPQSDRFSWVNLLKDLKSREEPFTIEEIAKETGQKRRYVYSHLREWVQDGDLKKVIFGGRAYFLAASQVQITE